MLYIKESSSASLCHFEIGKKISLGCLNPHPWGQTGWTWFQSILYLLSWIFYGFFVFFFTARSLREGKDVKDHKKTKFTFHLICSAILLWATTKWAALFKLDSMSNEPYLQNNNNEFCLPNTVLIRDLTIDKNCSLSSSRGMASICYHCLYTVWVPFCFVHEQAYLIESTS